MTKKEVCHLLGISPKTLSRRMAKGVYKFTKAEGQYGEVSFTYADIGLTEPIAATVAVEAPTPVSVTEITEPETAVAPTPLSNIELARQADERFAQDFKSGNATDSAGNKYDGTNERWPTKGAVSIIGPHEPMPKVRPDTTAHMDPALVGGGERIENPVDSDAFLELIHPGSADRKANMYAQCGVRPLSQQQQKEYNDKLALHAAFRWSR